MQIKAPLLIATLVSLVAANAHAQTVPLDSALQLGRRLRVFTPTVSSGRLTGRIEVIRSDSAYIWVNDRGVRPVPLAEIDSVQASRGKRHLSAAFLGIFVGATAGAATLGSLGYISGRNCTGECLPGGRLGALFGAMIGAPVGAAVMGARGFERWETMWSKPTVVITFPFE